MKTGSKLTASAAAAALIAAGTTAAAAATQMVGNGSPSFPSGLPPYWNKQAPSWCLEDMPCWIGSQSDGRTDSQSYVAWQQVVRGSYGCWVQTTTREVATCVDLYWPPAK